MDNKKNMKKLQKKKFDEEQMSQDCGKLIESKNLTGCKPKGVGVFCQSDGPPAAGGGIGMFLWLNDWQEMYQFLADYFVPFASGPSHSDHEIIYDEIWEIFNELAEGKIQRDQAFGRINTAAKNYSQIEWFGTFEDLCEGQGEFEKKVRQNCLCDSDGKSFTEKAVTSEKKKFMDAIANYGF